MSIEPAVESRKSLNNPPSSKNAERLRQVDDVLSEFEDLVAGDIEP